MRTGKALIEAGLSGAATGLPGGGSSSAVQLVVSSSAAQLASAMVISADEGAKTHTERAD